MRFSIALALFATFVAAGSHTENVSAIPHGSMQSCYPTSSCNLETQASTGTDDIPGNLSVLHQTNLTKRDIPQKIMTCYLILEMLVANKEVSKEDLVEMRKRMQQTIDTTEKVPGGREYSLARCMYRMLKYYKRNPKLDGGPTLVDILLS
ncbi:hypothetical protein BC835DRAFT_1382761 [Cytidiella melzeri]|nr:hypothetical protein BC835DRAFT_1382761 [Cytidiella melzeri]